MLPKEPPRRSQLGFLFVPPYRIQGLSVAGEQTVVQVPELDLVFDIGLCPRAALASNYLALTHGHMDHAAGLAYYFSQRYFQGMGVGTVICHPDLERPIRNVMTAWIDLEAQKTPYELITLAPEEQFPIKNNIDLRAFATQHTVPSLGYVVVEKRNKLKPEYAELEQPQLIELKKQGVEISQQLQIPLITFTGDTAWGSHFERDDVINSKILITECTFLESSHRNRASVGKHLHLDHILELLEMSKAQAIILVHLSRRTHIAKVRQQLDTVVPEKHRDRLLLLMDNRTNRARYEQQVREAQAEAKAQNHTTD